MDCIRLNPKSNKSCFYPSDVIDLYKKKFGAFQNAEELTKREKKGLYKIGLFLEKKKIEKEKKKLKKSKVTRKLPKFKRIRMDQSTCKQRIVIDLSYFHENIMKHNDMRMCVKQLKRCYSENRVMPNPMQLHITSVNSEAEQILSFNNGFKNWDINIHENTFMEVFTKDEIVYLTSESDNVIDVLDDSKAYIIGGLLDHNSLKGMSLKKAIDNDLCHARLPINEYVNMKRLKVLPINQVFSILALVSGGSPWSEALLKILPQRKEAQLKFNSNADNLCSSTKNNCDYLKT